MNHSSFYKALIESKTNPWKEFQIFLFSGCNNRCNFCFFSKDQLSDYTGIDTIVMQAFQLIDEIRSIEASGKTSGKYQLNIMGGELFSDNIKDKYLNDYQEYCKIVKSAFPNLELKFVFISNLIFSDLKRVETLIKNLRSLKIDSYLGTSFDFKGRFSKSSLEIFDKNILSIDRSISNSISIVLTTHNIKALLKDDNMHFKKYYNLGFDLFFDYYSPDSDSKSKALTPSDFQIYQALTFLRDNYPKSYPVKDLLQNDFNFMTCRKSLTISKKSGCQNCRSLTCSNSDFSHSSSYDKKDNLDIESSFLKKYNCSSCEFFKKCGLGCFLQNSYKVRQVSEICIYKKFFKESSSK